MVTELYPIQLYTIIPHTPLPITVADPGSPLGGVDLVGGIDSWGGYILKILNVETKESGP